MCARVHASRLQFTRYGKFIRFSAGNAALWDILMALKWTNVSPTARDVTRGRDKQTKKERRLTRVNVTRQKVLNKKKTLYTSNLTFKYFNSRAVCCLE